MHSLNVIKDQILLEGYAVNDLHGKEMFQI